MAYADSWGENAQAKTNKQVPQVVCGGTTSAYVLECEKSGLPCENDLPLGKGDKNRKDSYNSERPPGKWGRKDQM